MNYRHFFGAVIIGLPLLLLLDRLMGVHLQCANPLFEVLHRMAHMIYGYVVIRIIEFMFS
jgi:hypothetical protein